MSTMPRNDDDRRALGALTVVERLRMHPSALTFDDIARLRTDDPRRRAWVRENASWLLDEQRESQQSLEAAEQDAAFNARQARAEGLSPAPWLDLRAECQRRRYVAARLRTTGATRHRRVPRVRRAVRRLRRARDPADPGGEPEPDLAARRTA
jgi:hypothetical protein